MDEEISVPPALATRERQVESLYLRLMGDRFAALPPAVRAAHQVNGGLRLIGRAQVSRGAGLLSRLIGSITGLPPAGEGMPVSVLMEARNGGEVWRRDFDGACFSTRLSQRGPLLVERFGLIRLGMELRNEPDGLSMPIRRWWIGPVPMPLRLAPRCLATELEKDGRFHFDVPIQLPVSGLLVHYRGWLEPA
jgi:hypothetical protein